MNRILITIICTFFSLTVLADDLRFKVLSQDNAIVSDVRSDEANVWIKLTADHLDDTVTVRISNKNQDYYRAWFNDSPDLVSAGYRGNGVWSDRVQTQANYIEYWIADQLVLHLERK
jgi:hypothetical protein